MNRAGGTGHLLRTVFLLEYRFLLPVFDHPGLRRDDVQLFLDLAEEGFTGSGLFLCVQLKMNLDARQVLVEAVRLGMPLTRLFRFCLGQFLFHLLKRDFQLGFVEQLTLEGQFLAACAELAQTRQAQFFFHQAQQFLQLRIGCLLVCNERIAFCDGAIFFGEDVVEIRWGDRCCRGGVSVDRQHAFSMRHAVYFSIFMR